MLRRRLAATTAAAGVRTVLDGKNLTKTGAPIPPAIPEDPVTPMDFSPHIEWYEYPREVWDPKFPYTRDEAIRMQDEMWDSTQEDMADKYGVRVISPPKMMFWTAWFISGLYIFHNLMAAYRASPEHPTWPQYRVAIQQSPDCPTIDEDEIYLSTWINPGHRQKWAKWDHFWAWKPLVKKGGVKDHKWKIEAEKKDPSEWSHMLGK
uniref:Uncharacterized protein n=1 Tax=Neobodo designis TaxID=312471 RepID=A0A7S1MJH3_NEODS|mmetsp:Transcript_41829/g.129254  ORF Transcript_41829/g.129254 Transcript_41829/m.129254 type:complete len:206 (+) Transcript_41829:143-760(+)|eukprot:CAMPEP_0174850202 /NCGR_PEP_ID=MMETSP1114-20130205/19096_1 /TAXON_ID=312471 /ORGANISM="Neobodo designis, Strain CCAP 1951/1" /LENGTH=205 /DNA_ID=CAMNT_0016084639 /DNA_START=144 /DNA_END=761 /DNA_ORIENTATION=-